VKRSFIQHALIAAALLLSASLCLAGETKPAASGGAKASGTPGATEKSAKKAPAKPKAVDINSAGKVELKKLPGIDDAAADRIVAGRPYLSKAHLVTRNIIPKGVYEQIKKQIIAVQKPEYLTQKSPSETKR